MCFALLCLAVRRRHGASPLTRPDNPNTAKEIPARSYQCTVHSPAHRHLPINNQRQITRINRYFQLNIDGNLKPGSGCVCNSVSLNKRAYLHMEIDRPNVCPKTWISICLSVALGKALFHSMAGIDLLHCCTAGSKAKHATQSHRRVEHGGTGVCREEQPLKHSSM